MLTYLPCLWLTSFPSQVGDKIVGAGVGNPPKQGSSVSLSSDGTFLAVGGPAYSNGIGAVWLFKYDGSTYRQIDALMASDYITQLGNAVSLSSDGSVLAVGAASSSSGGGVAYVFRYEEEEEAGSQAADP